MFFSFLLDAAIIPVASAYVPIPDDRSVARQVLQEKRTAEQRRAEEERMQRDRRK